MSITLKRQLDESEKQIILKQHGRFCFATGHPIAATDQVQFDHITAFRREGATELDNIAPMCALHNREKGTLPLQDFRIKLRLQEFFKSGEKLTLKDLLRYFKEKGDVTEFGSPVTVEITDGQVTLQSAHKTYVHTAEVCPITGWKYFYATLGVDILDSDDDRDDKIGLQPRYLIFDKVFELYRHFQQHPVLQPSMGRIVEDHVRLFDGQHKAAALLWNGLRVFECKIYLDPDVRLLNQTNISAHDKFAQTRFYSSIMVMKLGSQFGADFENYKNTENGAAKTEAGFMQFLAKQDASQTQGQLNQRFRSYLYDSVLKDGENKASKYVSESNRSTDEKPLTIDLLNKSVFSCFIYREPTDDNMATDAYRRDDELHNSIMLLNSLYDSALSQWDSKGGPNDEDQRRLERLFRSKSMMAWAELLRDAICGKLELQDAEDRARPFYRQLTEKQIEQVRNVVNRLVSWKRWNSPANDELDRILSDNKSEVKEWFKSKGLTTGYLMGASE
jgi:hypothetical protein